jgi:hypothetical protein
MICHGNERLGVSDKEIVNWVMSICVSRRSRDFHEQGCRRRLEMDSSWRVDPQGILDHRDDNMIGSVVGPFSQYRRARFTESLFWTESCNTAFTSPPLHATTMGENKPLGILTLVLRFFPQMHFFLPILLCSAHQAENPCCI